MKFKHVIPSYAFLQSRMFGWKENVTADAEIIVLTVLNFKSSRSSILITNVIEWSIMASFQQEMWVVFHCWPKQLSSSSVLWLKVQPDCWVADVLAESSIYHAQLEWSGEDEGKVDWYGREAEDRALPNKLAAVHLICRGVPVSAHFLFSKKSDVADHPFLPLTWSLFVLGVLLFTLPWHWPVLRSLPLKDHNAHLEG